MTAHSYNNSVILEIPNIGMSQPFKYSTVNWTDVCLHSISMYPTLPPHTNSTHFPYQLPVELSLSAPCTLLQLVTFFSYPEPKSLELVKMFLLLDQISYLVIVYSIITCQYPLLLFGYWSWFVDGLVCKFVW